MPGASIGFGADAQAEKRTDASTASGRAKGRRIRRRSTSRMWLLERIASTRCRELRTARCLAPRDARQARPSFATSRQEAQDAQDAGDAMHRCFSAGFAERAGSRSVSPGTEVGLDAPPNRFESISAHCSPPTEGDRTWLGLLAPSGRASLGRLARHSPRGSAVRLCRPRIRRRRHTRHAGS
jgi:hypothetical protein